MSLKRAPSEEPAASPHWAGLTDVDPYGLPLDIFGDRTPPEFFEVVGRIVAINAKIEYLRERLASLPPSETSGVKKVELFLKRDTSGRMDRNAIVHSFWVFGANTSDSDVILGIRYKKRKTASGNTATVSIRDVPNSESVQNVVQYKLNELRDFLKRDLTTMKVGQLAYTEVMMTWAANQDSIASEETSESQA
jgi:hypothetical protein